MGAYSRCATFPARECARTDSGLSAFSHPNIIVCRLPIRQLRCTDLGHNSQEEYNMLIPVS